MQDKPALKSTTVWGAILIAVAGVLTVIGNYLQGNIDVLTMLQQLAVPVGAFLSIFGIRNVFGKLVGNT